MGMDRIRERLATGQPPLRVGELAELIGYSPSFVRKCVDAGTIAAVSLEGSREHRIPVQEAVRLARDLRLVE